MKKTSFEYYCVILSNTYQLTNNMESGFPQTSSQTPPTSGHSNWPNWDPHMGYIMSGAPLADPASPITRDLVDSGDCSFPKWDGLVEKELLVEGRST